MKIGVAFGGYCPLHQGHMDVIMRAKKENERTFVFVCGYDGEPRGGNDIPLDIRYRIIKNFLEDDLVKVERINDTELGIDESMSDHNWSIWLSFVWHTLYKNGICSRDNVTFYVGEESYREPILKFANFFKCIVFKRSENPISGTLCRKEPLKHWSQITAPFRSYYSHNILIAGTASEGKTTLCQDLGRYFGLPYSYEKGRDLYQFKTVDSEFNAKDFIHNLYEQHKYNQELISSPQNPGVFVSDTDNVVTLMYAKAYSERKGFALKPEDYQLLYSIAKVYNETEKWDKVFLTSPHARDIVDDGQRYMADSDFNIRVKFFETLCSIYDDFGIEYEILSGNYYENFCRVRDYIRGLYE